MSKEKKEKVIEVVLVDLEIMRKGGPKKSFVVPGHKKAEVGDKITWKLRNTGATFYFFNEELFGKLECPVKKDGELSLKVKKAAKGKEYPYAILTDNNDFAEGGSFPRMIIR